MTISKSGKIIAILIAISCLLFCATVFLLLDEHRAGAFPWLFRNAPIKFGNGNVKHYGPAPTTGPTWNLTNAIPLSPDAAVRSAIQWEQKNTPSVLRWDVEKIELQHTLDESNPTWYYVVQLMDRQGGSYQFKVIRVLLNGEIWKPIQ